MKTSNKALSKSLPRWSLKETIRSNIDMLKIARFTSCLIFSAEFIDQFNQSMPEYIPRTRSRRFIYGKFTEDGQNTRAILKERAIKTYLKEREQRNIPRDETSDETSELKPEAISEVNLEQVMVQSCEMDLAPESNPPVPEPWPNEQQFLDQ